MNKVLVAYASKYGATAGIAEKIGEVLNQEGLQSDVLPAKQVRDLSAYKAVIIGSAVYLGMFRREAATFLKTNEVQLSKLPVWMFSSGPIDSGDPMELLEGWLFPESLRPVIDNIQPRDIICFGGKAEMKNLNLFEKFIVKKVNSSMGDFRNWDTIVAWAEGIADKLK